ncbi:MAG: endonuclease YncB(thermonuclease family) [Enterobacterales bacterium]|jgi:endonuclease YncB( thermonuclease family)
MSKLLIRLFCSVIILLSSVELFSINAAEFGPYEATILEVREADTFFVEVETWPNNFQRVFIRLKDIDSPEPLRSKGGRPVSRCEKKAAKKAITFAQDILDNANKISVSNVSEIKSTANYVFARIFVDGKDLSRMLINNKHAISTSGLKRKRWTCRSR